MLRRKPLRLTFAILAVELFALACEPTSVAPTGVATSFAPTATTAAPSPRATPIPATPLPSSADQLLVGELDVGGIDATCPFIRDDQGNRWILVWPPGVTWGYPTGRLVLTSADGSVIARQGDRIGVRGAYGLFYGDEVAIDLDLSLVKPGLSDSDTLRDRRNALRVWAPKHGLAYGESWGNGRFPRDWEFTIEDGTFVDDKVVELLALPEVRSASRRGGLASMCSVAKPGALLTAVAIEFVEPAASMAPSSMP